MPLKHGTFLGCVLTLASVTPVGTALCIYEGTPSPSDSASVTCL